MSPPSPLFMGRKVEESQTLSQWPFPSTTETDPMPSTVMGDSERAVGKLKKGEGCENRTPNVSRTEEPNGGEYGD